MCAQVLGSGAGDMKSEGGHRLYCTGLLTPQQLGLELTSDSEVGVGVWFDA